MAVRDYQFITGPETSTLPTASTPTDDGDVVTVSYYKNRFTAKGSLLTATAAATPVELTTASALNGQVLVKDSTVAEGMKWDNAPTGLKNYISNNANLESGTITGFSLGTLTVDATTKQPTGSPTFGSGASVNLSRQIISSGQLAGSHSISLISAAATTQGDCLHTDAFSIDVAGRGQNLGFKISYKVIAGLANLNLSGTSSNSFGVAFRDITNGTWLYPTGTFNFVQGSGVGFCTGTVQTDSTTASMRMIIYNANATSGLCEIYFDDFYLGPQVTAAGAAISEPKEYTPTFNGFGTPTNVDMFYRIIGDSMEITGRFTTGTVTAAEARIGLPSVTSAGTDKISAIRVAGNMARTDVAALQAIPLIEPSVTYLTIGYQSASTGGLSKVLGSAFSTGEVVSVYAMVPIAGLSSQTVMSSDSDTRVIAAKATSSTTAILTVSNTTLVYPSVSFDKSTSYSNSTGIYTVPVSGVYRVEAGAYTANTGALTIGQLISLNAKQAGSATVTTTIGQWSAQSTTATTAGVNGATLFNCVAGDTLLIEIGNSTGNTITLDGSVRNYFSISRLSGPATIAASESVNLSYYGSTLTIASEAVAIMPTKVYDSHNAYNASTGIFTAPISGKYRFISAGNSSSTVASSVAGDRFVLALQKNGSTVKTLGTFGYQVTGVALRPDAFGSAEIDMIAGETASIVGSKNGGIASFSLDGTATGTYLMISRIGN